MLVPFLPSLFINRFYERSLRPLALAGADNRHNNRTSSPSRAPLLPFTENGRRASANADEWNFKIFPFIFQSNSFFSVFSLRIIDPLPEFRAFPRPLELSNFSPTSKKKIKVIGHQSFVSPREPSPLDQNLSSFRSSQFPLRGDSSIVGGRPPPPHHHSDTADSALKSPTVTARPTLFIRFQSKAIKQGRQSAP